jgi:hypothetical protein
MLDGWTTCVLLEWKAGALRSPCVLLVVCLCERLRHEGKNTWEGTPSIIAVRAAVLQEAMAAGHVFSLSANGVLLCEGPLPVQYVQHVAQQHLQQLWAQHMPNP